MKVRFLSILAIVALFAACNPFVIDLLPDRNGKTYTVTFDKNGGTTEASPQTITVTAPETTVKTLPAEPARTGYEFAGWNTQANGSGDTFTASTTVTEDITVYAQWISENAFAVNFQMTGNIAGDSLIAVPKAAEDGETVTINYALAGGFINNRLVFSGIKAHIALVDADTNGTTGTRTYKIDKDDAIGRTITIVAAFTHTNKNIDTIELPSESVQKEYGDTAFSMAVSNSGQGSGAITYSSSNTNIATVDSAGLVTIVAAGACEIIATKAADDVWETTTDTCTLHIAKLKLTISGTAVTLTKPYDTTTTAAVTSAGTLGNVVGSDAVTVSATAAYNSPNVAEANRITVTYTISGAQAGNYEAPDPYEITTGVSISKAPAPALASPSATHRLTDNIIHLVAVIAAEGGQVVEYAVSTLNTAPSSGWQEGRVFTGLTANTDHYAFARAKESANYLAGAASAPATLKTKTAPGSNAYVDPLKVDFESNISLNVTPGNGSGAATRTADPANSGQQSLQMVSNNYNRGAIVPINLPFALTNYHSFSFRFRLTNGAPTSPISVYVADVSSKFVNYGFGNPANHSQQNQQFANLLLGEVKADYSMGNEWVTYTIYIPDDAQSFSTIQNLQGDIFLAIGINHGSNLTILLDDLTFYAKSDFVPPPTISPTSATYVTTASPQQPVTVTMTLYGKTLTSISNGGTALTQTTHYTVSGSTVTLLPAYFNTQAVGGTTTLTFTFSDNSTKDIAIRIRNTSTITEYTFSTSPAPAARWAPNTPNNGTITWSSGQLEVNTGAGYSGNMMVLLFDLGTGSLQDYASIQVNIVGVSGQDLGVGKGFRIIAPASGSTITAGADNTTANRRLVDTSVTINASGSPGNATYSISNAPNTTGEIEIGFYFNTNPITYRITSVKLIPK